MAKGKFKLKKEGWIIISLVVIIFFLFIYMGALSNLGAPREGTNSSSGGGGGSHSNTTCQSNDDCSDRVERYCVTNSTECTFITGFNCTLGICVPINCTKYCLYCPYGCVNGRCQLNKSDLIVYSANYFIQTDRIAIINISIKNIGFNMVHATRTKIYKDSTLLFSLETSQILSGMIKALNPVTYIQAPHTSSTLRIVADADNQEDELNENNNELSLVVAT